MNHEKIDLSNILAELFPSLDTSVEEQIRHRISQARKFEEGVMNHIVAGMRSKGWASPEDSAELTAERDSLRAQLAERRVVVPELTQEDCEKAISCGSMLGRSGAFRMGWAGGMYKGYTLAASRARAIDPATECVVGRDLVDACKDAVKECEDTGECDMSRIAAALREGRG